MVPLQRDALVKSVLQKVQLGALEEASLLVCKSSHLSTVGEVMESLVVCLMETDTKTRTAGGQLLDMLLIRGAFEPELMKKRVLEKLVEMAVDMIEVVPNFWDSLAEIFCPSFNSAALPLSVIKDSANLLPSDKMVGHFFFDAIFETQTPGWRLFVGRLERDGRRREDENPQSLEGFRAQVDPNGDAFCLLLNLYHKQTNLT